MINVRLVGGAKKSFAADHIEIDKSDIAVNDLFTVLQDMRLVNSPELDPKNTLVAINGVDTSAIDGAASMVRDGDVVSIIPVIHGGATKKRFVFDIGQRRVQLFGLRADKSMGPEFLVDLRRRHPKLLLQAVSNKFVLGPSHTKKVVELSLESKKRGILLANRLEADILMRFAITRQISAAIKSAGMHPNKGGFLLIGIGPRRSLDSLYSDLSSILEDPFVVDNTKFLKRRFHITQNQLNATHSSVPLEDILVEKAAVLAAT